MRFYHPNKQNFSALDLLEAYLDLHNRDSNASEWSEERFADRPPLFYRYQRLVALAKAFEVEAYLSKFETGSFILSRKHTNYPLLQSDIEEFIKEKNPNIDTIHELSLQMIYHRFFTFIHLAEQILDLGVGGEAPLFAVYMTDRMDKFHPKGFQVLQKIKKLVACLIDPMERKFSKSELMEKYQFPDVELWLIDRESNTKNSKR